MDPTSADDVYDDVTIEEAQRAVLAANPLARGRSGFCAAGPFPLWKMAVPGLAEHGDSPEAHGLRAFIAHNPWGMSSVSGGDWVLLAEDGDQVCFGQREGDIGVGAVLTLTRKNGRWDPTQLGGSSGLYLGPDVQPARIESARLVESTLDFTWAGTWGEQTVDRVETVRDDAGFYVLIVIRDRTAPEPGWNSVAGSRGTLGIHLEAASAGVSIFDAAYVPARPIPLSH